MSSLDRNMIENDNILPPYNKSLELRRVPLKYTNYTTGKDEERVPLKYTNYTTGKDEEDDQRREHDLLLPIANVGRIMKQILPPKAKISKESKETMQECVSEFISFVTGEASAKCSKEKRKTIDGDDICWALGSSGFDDYAEALKRYLHKYREAEEERVNHNKAKEGQVPVDFGLSLMEKRRI